MANESDPTADKNKLFIKNIINKTNIIDEKTILAIVAKAYSEKLHKSVPIEAIEKQFINVIREVISEYNQDNLTGKKESVKQAQPQTSDPILAQRDQLFMKSGRRFLDNLLADIMNRVLQSDVEYNNNSKDKILTNLFASRTDIINKAKVDTWQDLLDFIKEYLDYFYEQGLYVKEPEEAKDKIDEEIARLLAVTIVSDDEEGLSEEEKEKLRQERKKSKRKTPKINIKDYITDSKFMENYYTLLKKHVSVLLEQANSFRPSEIAESFFEEHRSQFKEEIETRVEVDIIDFLTRKVDSIYKVKDVEALFDEKIDIINSRVKETIKKLLASKSSRQYYLKMSPSDIVHRIYELTLKDPKVGGIVGVDRDRTITIISKTIKSDFINEDIFKQFA